MIIIIVAQWWYRIGLICHLCLVNIEGVVVFIRLPICLRIVFDDAHWSWWRRPLRILDIMMGHSEGNCRDQGCFIWRLIFEVLNHVFFRDKLESLEFVVLLFGFFLYLNLWCWSVDLVSGFSGWGLYFHQVSIPHLIGHSVDVYWSLVVKFRLQKVGKVLKLLWQGHMIGRGNKLSVLLASCKLLALPHWASFGRLLITEHKIAVHLVRSQSISRANQAWHRSDLFVLRIVLK